MQKKSKCTDTPREKGTFTGFSLYSGKSQTEAAAVPCMDLLNPLAHDTLWKVIGPAPSLPDPQGMWMHQYPPPKGLQHMLQFPPFPSVCFQDSQHRDTLCYSVVLCLCVRHHYCDSGEAEAVKVTLQLFQTVGEDFTFLTCHLYRAGIRTWLHLQQERKEAGQYFLVNGSCLGTSAKEQNLHNFQHPTNLADNGFLSKKSLAFACLKNTAADDTKYSNVQSQQFHGNCCLLNTDENPAACIPYGTASFFFNPDQTVLI